MESMNMNDLGESYPSHPCGCSDCEDRENGKEQKKHYPRESFTTEQMPELKGLTVGDKVKIVIECEVASVSMGDEYGMGEEEDKPKTRVSLKMLQGSATKMSGDTGTVAEQTKKKEKDFSKMIGAEDTEEEADQEDK